MFSDAPPSLPSADTTQRAFAFSDPFIMAIGDEETVGQLRQRVQQKFGVSDEEFSKWRTLLVS